MYATSIKEAGSSSAQESKDLINKTSLSSESNALDVNKLQTDALGLGASAAGAVGADIAAAGATNVVGTEIADAGASGSDVGASASGSDVGASVSGSGGVGLAQMDEGATRFSAANQSIEDSLSGLTATRRGVSSIFVGAAPGVGKSAALFQEALKRKAQHKKVVVGWLDDYPQLYHDEKTVEAAKAAAAAAIADGVREDVTRLERVEPLVVSCNSKSYVTVNVPKLLEMKPDVVVIENLAAPNPPGARNNKRWQDVQELVYAGIDVMSSLNIQNIESINHVIYQVTGVRTSDTVPDKLFEGTDEIYFVDCPPSDLANRLEDGLIHIPPYLKSNAASFYRKSNLIALRDLSISILDSLQSEHHHQPYHTMISKSSSLYKRGDYSKAHDVSISCDYEMPPLYASLMDYNVQGEDDSVRTVSKSFIRPYERARKSATLVNEDDFAHDENVKRDNIKTATSAISIAVNTVSNLEDLKHQNINDDFQNLHFLQDLDDGDKSFKSYSDEDIVGKLNESVNFIYGDIGSELDENALADSAKELSHLSHKYQPNQTPNTGVDLASSADTSTSTSVSAYAATDVNASASSEVGASASVPKPIAVHLGTEGSDSSHQNDQVAIGDLLSDVSRIETVARSGKEQGQSQDDSVQEKTPGQNSPNSLDRASKVVMVVDEAHAILKHSGTAASGNSTVLSASAALNANTNAPIDANSYPLDKAYTAVKVTNETPRLEEHDDEASEIKRLMTSYRNLAQRYFFGVSQGHNSNKSEKRRSWRDIGGELRRVFTQSLMVNDDKPESLKQKTQSAVHIDPVLLGSIKVFESLGEAITEKVQSSNETNAKSQDPTNASQEPSSLPSNEVNAVANIAASAAANAASAAAYAFTDTDVNISNGLAYCPASVNANAQQGAHYDAAKGDVVGNDDRSAVHDVNTVISNAKSIYGDLGEAGLANGIYDEALAKSAAKQQTSTSSLMVDVCLAHGAAFVLDDAKTQNMASISAPVATFTNAHASANGKTLENASANGGANVDTNVGNSDGKGLSAASVDIAVSEAATAQGSINDNAASMDQTSNAGPAGDGGVAGASYAAGEASLVGAANGVSQSSAIGVANANGTGNGVGDGVDNVVKHHNGSVMDQGGNASLPHIAAGNAFAALSGGLNQVHGHAAHVLSGAFGSNQAVANAAHAAHADNMAQGSSKGSSQDSSQGSSQASSQASSFSSSKEASLGCVNGMPNGANGGGSVNGTASVNAVGAGDTYNPHMVSGHMVNRTAVSGAANGAGVGTAAGATGGAGAGGAGAGAGGISMASRTLAENLVQDVLVEQSRLYTQGDNNWGFNYTLNEWGMGVMLVLERAVSLKLIDEASAMAEALAGAWHCVLISKKERVLTHEELEMLKYAQSKGAVALQLIGEYSLTIANYAHDNSLSVVIFSHTRSIRERFWRRSLMQIAPDLKYCTLKQEELDKAFEVFEKSFPDRFPSSLSATRAAQRIASTHPKVKVTENGSRRLSEYLGPEGHHELSPLGSTNVASTSISAPKAPAYAKASAQETAQEVAQSQVALQASSQAGAQGLSHAQAKALVQAPSVAQGSTKAAAPVSKVQVAPTNVVSALDIISGGLEAQNKAAQPVANAHAVGSVNGSLSGSHSVLHEDGILDHVVDTTNLKSPAEVELASSNIDYSGSKTTTDTNGSVAPDLTHDSSTLSSAVAYTSALGASAIGTGGLDTNDLGSSASGTRASGTNGVQTSAAQSHVSGVDVVNAANGATVPTVSDTAIASGDAIGEVSSYADIGHADRVENLICMKTEEAQRAIDEQTKALTTNEALDPKLKAAQESAKTKRHLTFEGLNNLDLPGAAYDSVNLLDSDDHNLTTEQPDEFIAKTLAYDYSKELNAKSEDSLKDSYSKKENMELNLHGKLSGSMQYVEDESQKSYHQFIQYDDSVSSTISESGSAANSYDLNRIKQGNAENAITDSLVIKDIGVAPAANHGIYRDHVKYYLNENEAKISLTLQNANTASCMENTATVGASSGIAGSSSITAVAAVGAGAGAANMASAANMAGAVSGAATGAGADGDVVLGDKVQSDLGAAALGGASLHGMAAEGTAESIATIEQSLMPSSIEERKEIAERQRVYNKVNQAALHASSALSQVAHQSGTAISIDHKFLNGHVVEEYEGDLALKIASTLSNNINSLSCPMSGTRTIAIPVPILVRVPADNPTPKFDPNYSELVHFSAFTEERQNRTPNKNKNSITIKSVEELTREAEQEAINGKRHNKLSLLKAPIHGAALISKTVKQVVKSDTRTEAEEKPKLEGVSLYDNIDVAYSTAPYKKVLDDDSTTAYGASGTASGASGTSSGEAYYSDATFANEKQTATLEENSKCSETDICVDTVAESGFDHGKHDSSHDTMAENDAVGATKDSQVCAANVDAAQEAAAKVAVEQVDSEHGEAVGATASDRAVADYACVDEAVANKGSAYALGNKLQSSYKEAFADGRRSAHAYNAADAAFGSTMPDTSNVLKRASYLVKRHSDQKIKSEMQSPRVDASAHELAHEVLEEIKELDLTDHSHIFAADEHTIKADEALSLDKESISIPNADKEKSAESSVFGDTSLDGTASKKRESHNVGLVNTPSIEENGFVHEFDESKDGDRKKALRVSRNAPSASIDALSEAFDKALEDDLKQDLDLSSNAGLNNEDIIRDAFSRSDGAHAKDGLEDSALGDDAKSDSKRTVLSAAQIHKEQYHDYLSVDDLEQGFGGTGVSKSAAAAAAMADGISLDKIYNARRLNNAQSSVGDEADGAMSSVGAGEASGSSSGAGASNGDAAIAGFGATAGASGAGANAAFDKQGREEAASGDFSKDSVKIKSQKPWWRRVYEKVWSWIGGTRDYNIRSSNALADPVVPGLPNNDETSPRGIFTSVLLNLALTISLFPLIDVLYTTNLVACYLLITLFIALRFGLKTAVFSSLLSVFSFDYALVYPYLSFAVEDVQFLITFFIMVVIGLIVARLVTHRETLFREAQKREIQTRMLYDAARYLSTAIDDVAVYKIISRIFAHGMHIPLEFWRCNIDDDDNAFTKRHGLKHGDEGDGKNQSHVSIRREQQLLRHVNEDIVRWCVIHQKPAGFGTPEFSDEPYLYIPIIGNGALETTPADLSNDLSGIKDGSRENKRMGSTAAAFSPRSLGVMVLRLKHVSQWSEPSSRRLMHALMTLTAQALDRLQLVEEARQSLMSMEAERLRHSLIQSLSHDLRTPLTSLLANAELLRNKLTQGDFDAALSESGDLVIAAERMVRLMTNVMEMAKLQIGKVVLRETWLPPEEIIAQAKQNLVSRLAKFKLIIDIEHECPPFYADEVLLDRLLSNLIDNATKYCPEGSTILIEARREGDKMILAVHDNGPGFTVEDPNMLFEPFKRGEKESRISGVGLGLAICKTIAHVHHAELKALKSERLGGACFRIALQYKELPELDDEDMLFDEDEFFDSDFTAMDAPADLEYNDDAEVPLDATNKSPPITELGNIADTNADADDLTFSPSDLKQSAKVIDDNDLSNKDLSRDFSDPDAKGHGSAGAGRLSGIIVEDDDEDPLLKATRASLLK